MSIQNIVFHEPGRPEREVKAAALIDRSYSEPVAPPPDHSARDDLRGTASGSLRELRREGCLRTAPTFSRRGTASGSRFAMGRRPTTSKRPRRELKRYLSDNGIAESRSVHLATPAQTLSMNSSYCRRDNGSSDRRTPRRRPGCCAIR